MSLQWTLIAFFLYLEIAVVLILVLPVANPKKWQKIFQSRFLGALTRQASLYFYVLLFVLVLFLIDAMREMRKYSNAENVDKGQGHVHLDLEMQINMRLFRAQRNFYISGFALFLSLVIRRLCSLISSLATAQAQNEATLKQAKSATNAARELLAQNISGVASQNTANEVHDKELQSLKSEISSLQKQLAAALSDKEVIKKQAKSTNDEYDRLNEEYNQLLKKLHHAPEGDKKDD